MLKAVVARSSVHYVSSNTGFGRTLTLTSDVAKGRGIQRVRFTNQGETGLASVLVLARVAYIRGDEPALYQYFAFKKAQAATYAGKWISIPHGDRSYAPVAADATYASFVSSLLPTKNLAVASATRKGKKEVALRGTATQQGIPFTDWVYAQSAAKPLPLEEKSVVVGDPRAGTSLVTMSHWNEAVHLKAPAKSVPIAKVRGGGGGGPVA